MTGAEFSSQDLPLTALALGRASAAGEPQEPSERIALESQRCTVDGRYHFELAVLDDQPRWVRIPPGIAHGDTPPFVQRCDLRDRLERTHAIVSTTDGGEFPIVAWSSRLNLTQTRPALRLIERGELCISLDDLDDAYATFAPLMAELPRSPRLHFDWAALHARRGDLRTARAHFHLAALLGHPDALAAEWWAASLIAKPFREAHPELFETIQNGDRQAAIAPLRALIERDPLNASATLAYCLRSSRMSDEGIAICQRSLAIDALQSDMYGHLWSFLTDAGRDREALQVAETHLSLYPTNVQAYTDALDSALLLGEVELARRYAHGYLLQSTNPELALKNLFKLHERLNEWPELERWYNALLPLARAHAPDTLVQHGEVLLEVGKLEAATAVLERALQAAPERADTILAYGRALARANNERGAIRFLMSVLTDARRSDDPADRALLMTLLSQLLRETGNADKALQIWQQVAPIDMHQLAALGPTPFAEYARCLLALGESRLAKEIYTAIRIYAAESKQVQALAKEIG